MWYDVTEIMDEVLLSPPFDKACLPVGRGGGKGFKFFIGVKNFLNSFKAPIWHLQLALLFG